MTDTGSWAEKLIRFYLDLKIPRGLPAGIQTLYPFNDEQVQHLVRQFFHKFYNDNSPRKLILGINPGRFGAGSTGINFTAPRQLQICGIPHSLKDQTELSAEFIYRMIEAYGGPQAFYGDYFLGATSPLGFVRDGINMNYYDDPALAAALRPFIIACIRQLKDYGMDTHRCYCIGEDKNFKFLSKLNQEHAFFEELVPLPHPRFIMQYRRKKLDVYIQQYVEALQ